MLMQFDIEIVCVATDVDVADVDDVAIRQYRIAIIYLLVSGGSSLRRRR